MDNDIKNILIIAMGLVLTRKGDIDVDGEINARVDPKQIDALENEICGKFGIKEINFDNADELAALIRAS